MKKTLITFIALVFIGFAAQSQVSMNADELSNDWSLLTEKDGVKMYIKTGECQMSDDPTKPFTYGWIKLENTTSTSKDVNFRFNLIYTDGCVGCEGHYEYDKSVTITPNSAVSTDCNFDNNNLAILIKNPYQLAYQDFKSLTLTDLKVD